MKVAYAERSPFSVGFDVEIFSMYFLMSVLSLNESYAFFCDGVSFDVSIVLAAAGTGAGFAVEAAHVAALAPAAGVPAHEVDDAFSCTSFASISLSLAASPPESIAPPARR